MSDTVIRVENLSKRYVLGAKESLPKTRREAMANIIGAPVKYVRSMFGESGQEEAFWALKDVSFEVKAGEVVGIIGRNGAGKSTLLKILSRITKPSSGRAEIRGRVGSLLEVGTGFHPELTGRENIYLNGAILGMRRWEIDKKFDEIVAFAEIERFLDTPVKRYSSGMYVRLAFAVAAHLEPEILIVDEVLAVGDAAFQKKCLGKMGDVAAKEGRTVLFVSHNMTAVKSLCDISIWLDRGKIAYLGDTTETMERYLVNSTAIGNEMIWGSLDKAPGNDKVRWRRVAISSTSEEREVELTVATPLIVEFEFWNYTDNALLNLSLHLFSFDGVRILNTFSAPTYCSVGLVKGACYIPRNFLNDQTYRISVMIVENSCTILYVLEDALIFQVQDIEREFNWYGKWEGIVRPKFIWSIKNKIIEFTENRS
jgi:lipopolysaccharide transport system ATP-binding protein